MKFSRVKQFLKSKKVIRTGACVLAAVLVTGGVGAYHVYGQKAKTAQETAQERDADAEDSFADAEDVLAQVLKTQTKTDNDAAAEKEETVYVVADPAGTPNEVIVSDWLKNYLGADTIEDVSDLTDIENVKGDEKFTQGADGALTWQADGNDIYYQGKTDRDLPIEMKMTYYLDGEEITPEELAGKSGKVTIRADYTNKEKAENGVYVPFAAVTGMMLNKNFTNVEVTNGKVVSDGNNQVVVGFAFPGLSESLDLDSKNLEDVNIPDYVEVTADVKDFSLDMTMTFVMSDILQELDVDQDIDLSGIEDAIDSLSDASAQLVSGSRELADGTGTLLDGIKAYTSGVSTLKNGISAYTDGVAQVKNGVDSYTAGVAQVASGTKQLADKSGDLKNGITQLVSGAMQVQTYFEGDNGIVSGAQKISAGIDQLDAALHAGVTEEEAAQAEETVNKMFAKDGETYQEIAKQAAGQYKTALIGSDELQSKVERGVSQAMYGAYKTAYQQLNAEAYAQAGKSDALEADAKAYADKMTAASASSVSNVSSQLISGIADGTSTQIGGMAAEAAKQGAVAGAKSGIAATKSAIASQIENGGLVTGAQTLSAGVQKLYSEGIQPLAVGMQSLNNSVPELMKGIQTLNAGAATLDSNSATLKAGVNTLNSKGGELKAGVTALDNNSGNLSTGAAKLKDGAQTLSDGMIQFDEEGIQKLSDAYHGDVEELLDRVDLVLDAGQSYHTFSGLKDDMSGSVKFIIRTEAIEN
ncbi:hypothetical protein [uncultured Eubacterium sp.]|uniref:hypothetical protein n=1 Tax=uncultured Eubacterium sp. TaxID=165185 RepID=UPI0025966B53|nr:hypothetical protein [uncultured Eubacterium sp.]